MGTELRKKEGYQTIQAFVEEKEKILWADV
jgi:hypothetical protein